MLLIDLMFKCIHADTLNEMGFMEDTMAAVKDRVLHMYHTEGAGGGHAYNLVTSAAFSNILQLHLQIQHAYA